MWRFLHIVAIGALIASAFYAYGIKYKAIFASEEVEKTRQLIVKERDAIELLRAEYAHLTRPERLQRIADQQLQMQPLALNQIVKPEDLPEAGPKVDSIGRELQSLGLIGGSASPSMGVTGATPALR